MMFIKDKKLFGLWVLFAIIIIFSLFFMVKTIPKEQETVYHIQSKEKVTIDGPLVPGPPKRSPIKTTKSPSGLNYTEMDPMAAEALYRKKYPEDFTSTVKLKLDIPPVLESPKHSLMKLEIREAKSEPEMTLEQKADSFEAIFQYGERDDFFGQALRSYVKFQSYYSVLSEEEKKSFERFKRRIDALWLAE